MMRFGLIVLLFLCAPFCGLGQTCTLNVNLTNSGTAICSGTSVVLTAAASGGTAPYTYSWSTGETTAFISVNKAGNYSVTVTDQTSGCPGVTKSVTISSSITPDAPTAANVATCQNTSATLTATGPGGNYNWYDANGKYLASGTSYTTPVLTATAAYYVETSVSGCVSPRTLVYVFIYGPPQTGDTYICAGNMGTVGAAGYGSYIWYDAPTGGNQLSNAPGSTYTPPVPLYNTTIYYVAGVINGCITGRSPATVYVTPAPQAPAVAGAAICAGWSVSLHADVPAGIIDWFGVPTGGTSLISSPDFTTPALAATTTYYVQNTLNGCVSARTPVTVNVTPVPAAPTAANATICSGTSATLSATSPSAANFQWFNRSTGGTALFTGSTFITPALTLSTTYYVEANNGSCGSIRTPVKVTVLIPPAPPIASDALICSGSVTILAAAGATGSYDWFSTATGGTSLFTGANFTTPALTANTTYYVQITDANGCVSNRTSVNVNILPVTNPPTAADAVICSSSTANLNATGAGNYQWYDAAINGNKLSDAQVYVTPALTATTIFYVQTIANGCPSTRTPVTVTVSPIPSAPAVNSVSPVCAGSSVTLMASGTGAIYWYDADTGGNQLASGNTYSPIVNATTTYYAQSNSPTCASSRSPVTVTVITNPSLQFKYPSNTVCATGGNTTPVIYNTAGGTFSASPAGLVFVNNSTGEIDVASSTQGVYNISFAGGGPCPAVSTIRFGIGLGVNATFSYNGPFCQGGVNPLPVFPSNISGAGNFTAAPAGFVFANSSTGEIDLNSSAPGTYTITNNIPAGGTCPGVSYSSSVTIYQQVTVNAGPNQTVASGTTVQLAGSVSGGASSGTWSGGAGTFSNSSAINVVYTPAAGETSAVLTLTSATPAGPCGPKTGTMNITFTTATPAPTASGIVICMGTSATLSATAPGGTYNWYDTPTGNNLLTTGPNYTTPVLIATTTYYVSATINGVTGPRSAVTVSVTPTPAAPIVNNPVVCMGNTAILTAGGSGAVTYNWYSTATGGTPIFTGATYVTRILYANTSYFVEAATAGGCTSTRTEADLVVNPIASITSADAGDICSGAALNYIITADVPTATFIWSRAAAAGISNAAVSNQTAAVINETLFNTTADPIDVTYTLYAVVNGCTGPAFTYVVTVYPTPVVTSAATATICNGTSTNYTVMFNIPQTSFSWSRAVVPGVSNQAVTGQTAATIHEVLVNTSNAPVNVTYIYTYIAGPCAGTTFNLVVIVNPSANTSSPASNTICSGTAQNYTIQSNVLSATFSWTRNTVPGISNAAVSDQTSGTINETLINTTGGPVNVVYNITATAFGCQGPGFNYVVTVNPLPATPVANGNSPVCVGSTIQLRTSQANGTYLWTGPNGFTSTLQNPNIANVTTANTGAYNLFILLNGCSSPAGTVDITVDPPPVSNAGPDKTVCANVTSVQLAGNVTGGTTTGLWATAGTGTFSPSANQLNAQYIPSAQDKTNGSVALTLVSTSKDDCAVSTSTTIITFGAVPAADAGPDQQVCSQTTAVPLNGKILVSSGGVWSTSGDGIFSPSATALNAFYVPGLHDTGGTVTLTLTANAANSCYISSDQMQISFIPPPAVNAGGNRYVLFGKSIVLQPTVSDNDVTYLWSPNINISDVTVRNPTVTGDSTRTYTLTVTDSRGCVSSDKMLITVKPLIAVNNTFTPNGDGINDLWNITGLIAYQDAQVSVFNRDGAMLFYSKGYPQAWDGTYNGRPLPVGTYYYVINTKLNNLVLSGSVTIIR